MFDVPTLGYDETDLAPGIRARFLTPDQALIEYLETHGMRRISKRLAASGALDVVATAVPGMKDILVLGKVKSLEEGRAADLVIVDAPAAGHAITFLLSARGLLDAVRVGPIRKQATDVVALLGDPARCQVLLVTAPEETPVSEAIDTAFAIEDRAGVALGPVVVNGCFPPLLAGVVATADAITRDADAIDRFVVAARGRATSRRRPRSASSATASSANRSRGSAERLPLPQIQLPFVFTPDIHRAEVDVLADAIADGIEAL